MANTLRFKRGLVSGIPTAALGEPLFTTDTFDLYIGNGTTNTRFQKYIASGATTQILRGDGSLYTFPLAISSPSAGQVLKYNGTSWVNDSDAGITGSGAAGQVAFFTGATTQGGSNNLFWDNANARLGIGYTGGAVKLAIKGGNGDQVLLDNAGERYTQIGFRNNNVQKAILYLDNTNNTFETYGGSGVGLTFYTNATHRARITSGGNFIINNASTDNGLRFQVTGDGYFSGSVGIGTTSGLSLINFRISKDISGATTAYGQITDGQIQTGVTANGVYSQTTANTAASTTLTNIYYSRLIQGTFGAGSTITNQFGYFVDASLTGATNNYGFYGNIASGTGRWNLYMAGTANNYMAGSLGIGSTSITGINLLVLKNLTGAITPIGISSQGQIQSDATSHPRYFTTVATTQNATFTINSLTHYQAAQGTFGASSTVNNQYGYLVDASLTGATNNYGFYGNIASGSNRWNLYMNGTANNYMAGSLGIGTTTLTAVSVRIGRNFTGGTVAYGIYAGGAVLNDVTNIALNYYSRPDVAAGTTLTTLYHFVLDQGTISGTVANQYGYVVGSNMVGATNNYGFYGNIASGTGRWNLYMNGSASNYVNGELLIGTTTSAGTKLYVNGTAQITSNLFLGVNSSSDSRIYLFNASNTSRGEIYFDGNNSLKIESTYTTSGTYRPITFWTSAAERVRIDESGNLIVGTNTAQNRLTIMGSSSDTAIISGTTVERVANFVPSNNLGNAIFAFDTTSGNSYLYSGYSNGALIFGTRIAPNNFERMRLDASGNLGLGTTSPLLISGYTTLAVNGSTGGNIDLMSGGVRTASWNNSASECYFGTRTNAPLAFTVNSTEYARFFATTGNLRIGTSAGADAGYRLDVNGTMRVSGASTFNANVGIGGTPTAFASYNVLGINGTAGGMIELQTNGTSTGLLFSGTNLITLRASTSSAIRFETNGNNERMRITSAGDVGIGTSSPTAKLDVVGAATFSSSVTAASFIPTSSTIPTNGMYLSAANTLAFATASGNKLTISSTGLATFSDSARFSNQKGCIFVQTGGSLLGSISMDSGNAITIDNNGFFGLSVGTNYTMTGGNLGIGHNSFGTSATKTISVNNGTAPSSSPVDSFQMYSNDVVAGNAAPHFRTENGAVIKLYQQTTSTTDATYIGGGGTTLTDLDTFDGYRITQIVKALRNAGILQ